MIPLAIVVIVGAFFIIFSMWDIKQKDQQDRKANRTAQEWQEDIKRDNERDKIINSLEKALKGKRVIDVRLSPGNQFALIALQQGRYTKGVLVEEYREFCESIQDQLNHIISTDIAIFDHLGEIRYYINHLGIEEIL